MTGKNHYTESGFTLQEVLVAVNVGFLMISFCLMLLLSINKIVGTWQSRSMVKNSVNMVVNRILIDAERATIAFAPADSLLVLQPVRDKAISYLFTGGRVFRRETPMNDRSQVRIEAAITHEQTQTGETAFTISVIGQAGSYKYGQSVGINVNPDAKTRFKSDERARDSQSIP